MIILIVGVGVHGWPADQRGPGLRAVWGWFRTVAVVHSLPPRCGGGCYGRRLRGCCVQQPLHLVGGDPPALGPLLDLRFWSDFAKLGELLQMSRCDWPFCSARRGPVVPLSHHPHAL